MASTEHAVCHGLLYACTAYVTRNSKANWQSEKAVERNRHSSAFPPIVCLELYANRPQTSSDVTSLISVVQPVGRRPHPARDRS
jgi:hypothetical protein